MHESVLQPNILVFWRKHPDVDVVHDSSVNTTHKSRQCKYRFFKTKVATLKYEKLSSKWILHLPAHALTKF